MVTEIKPQGCDSNTSPPSPKAQLEFGILRRLPSLCPTDSLSTLSHSALCPRRVISTDHITKSACPLAGGRWKIQQKIGGREESEVRVFLSLAPFQKGDLGFATLLYWRSSLCQVVFSRFLSFWIPVTTSSSHPFRPRQGKNYGNLVVPNQGDFSPKETFAISGDMFHCHEWGKCYWHLANRWQRCC